MNEETKKKGIELCSHIGISPDGNNDFVLRNGSDTNDFYAFIKYATSANDQLSPDNLEEIFNYNTRFKQLNNTQQKAFITYVYSRYQDIITYLDYVSTINNGSLPENYDAEKELVGLLSLVKTSIDSNITFAQKDFNQIYIFYIRKKLNETEKTNFITGQFVRYQNIIDYLKTTEQQH